MFLRAACYGDSTEKLRPGGVVLVLSTFIADKGVWHDLVLAKTSVAGGLGSLFACF